MYIHIYTYIHISMSYAHVIYIYLSGNFVIQIISADKQDPADPPSRSPLIHIYTYIYIYI